ncbi:MAG: hypothetical protein WD118_07245 [Phycisphaeraceae bacterium]
MLGTAACGGDDPGSNGQQVGGGNSGSLGPSTILKLAYEDGEGERETAALTCTDDGASGTGYMKAQAAIACKQVDSLKNLLTKPPAEDRACTQIYGGPQKLRVSGRVDFDTVASRTFERTNGCEIAEWKRLAPLLPESASGI